MSALDFVPSLRVSAPAQKQFPAAQIHAAPAPSLTGTRFTGVIRVAVALFAVAAVSLSLDAAEQSTVPGLNIVMVKVARGTFTLGHADGYAGSSPDEKPATKVTFTKDFWLGATEIAVAQWRHFVGYISAAEKTGNGIWVSTTANNVEKREKIPGLSWRSPGFAIADNHPVVGVSWEDAQQFCRWLTEREGTAGRVPAGYVYRIPTEAQWEYAARAGSTDDPANAGDVAWYRENSGGMLHPVGTKKPNPWGLYDMQGSVWEWVHDWYGRYPGGEVSDFEGPSSVNDRSVLKPHREKRGGWINDGGGHGIMTTNRWSTWGQDECNWVGFRVALSTVAPPSAVAPKGAAQKK
jgi:formylglycine-generating enzyme required for sulfatase activity